jgi:hypothetical protein
VALSLLTHICWLGIKFTCKEGYGNGFQAHSILCRAKYESEVIYGPEWEFIFQGYQFDLIFKILQK